jgi:hypothetical protein
MALQTPAMFIDFTNSPSVTGKKASSAAVNGSMPKVSSRARHQHGKTERVEAAIREHKIFLQRRQNLAVLARDLFHLLDYG